MSDSPQADAWFNGGFQVPWGWDPGGVGGTESIKQNLVSTNSVSFGTLDELRRFIGTTRFAAPYYVVMRHLGIDYAFRPGVFRMIVSPDDYHFLMSCWYIVQPHGTAPSVERNLLEYIRREAARVGGGQIDDMPPLPSAQELEAMQAQFDEPCPICELERAQAATDGE